MAALGVPRERVHTGKTLNLCSLFGAWFPHPAVSRATRRRFSRGGLTSGTSEQGHTGAGMGQGDSASMHPRTPLRTQLCPCGGANSRHSRESSAESRSCHLLHLAPQRAGGSPAPSHWPYCYSQSSRAASSKSRVLWFRRGDEDMSKAKDMPSEGGLSSSRGRGVEGAAKSRQPGRWCQQRRG